MAERLTVNQDVAGSSPAQGAKFRKDVMSDNHKIRQNWKDKEFTSNQIQHYFGFDTLQEFLNLQRNADHTFLNATGELVFEFKTTGRYPYSSFTRDLMDRYAERDGNEITHRMKETYFKMKIKSFLQVDIDVLEKAIKEYEE